MEERMIEEKTHALLSPSGASRWTRCPGSVVLEQGQPDRVGIHAASGTVMHSVAEMCLNDPDIAGRGRTIVNAEAYVGRVFESDGFSIEFDMDMADTVNEYVSLVGNIVDPSAGDILLVEQSVPLEHLTGEQGATGTADVVGITRDGTELVVIDLKTGRGVQVFADNNEQLYMYALGALEQHDLFYDFERVRMVIVQPRLHHVDECVVPIDEVRAKAEWFKVRATSVRNAQRDMAALGPSFYLDPGEKQCRFCKAKAICPALRQEVTTIVSQCQSSDFDDLTAETVPATAAELMEVEMAIRTDVPASLGVMLDKVPLVETWCKAVRAAAEAELFAGRPVAGYKLVEGKRGNRAWKDAAEAEAFLKGRVRLKVDEMYNKTVISPTAAEKLLKEKPKLLPAFEALVTRKDGQPSVAPESDKRPALVLGATADDFADLDVDPLS
jgi:hypothetical protein